MDLENRFRRTWKRFQEVLKVDYNCSLADVCREQHTTFGGMSSWMSRRGYSVKQAKADVVRDYYGGVEPSLLTTTSPAFTQIAPAMSSEEEFSLAGITITFKSLVLPGSQSRLTVEPPFRSNGPHPVGLLKCCSITKERREIHVFSNISQSILSVPGLCSYEPWHRRLIQDYTLGNEGLVSRFRRYLFILW